jgi:hypothetical protein
MIFTTLHRLLGLPPSPINDELLDAAVSAQLAEADDLDWKGELPPTKGLSETDFPKDVAAMANSGGGVIVYGVEESEKRASGRKPTGVLTENHERTLRAAAYGSITPPVFIGIHRVGEPGNEAVAVVVPASVDGPHLIFKEKFFGAPLRNDADTEWMKERQIEAAYRDRLDSRRRAAESLTELYDDANTNWNARDRVWLIAVARPRVPFTPVVRPSRQFARDTLGRAYRMSTIYASGGGVHPIGSVDRDNPRPGLRRWIAPNNRTEPESWKAAWAALHHDGSISLAAAVGGHRSGHQGDNLGPHQVESAGVECAVASFMSLIRAMSEALGIGEYEVMIGLEWAGPKPISIHSFDPYWGTEEFTMPLARFNPVRATVVADAPGLDFHWQIHGLAEDCVNQGGITSLHMINPPDRDGPGG